MGSVAGGGSGGGGGGGLSEGAAGGGTGGGAGGGGSGGGGGGGSLTKKSSWWTGLEKEKEPGPPAKDASTPSASMSSSGLVPGAGGSLNQRNADNSFGNVSLGILSLISNYQQEAGFRPREPVTTSHESSDHQADGDDDREDR